MGRGNSFRTSQTSPLRALGTAGKRVDGWDPRSSLSLALAFPLHNHWRVGPWVIHACAFRLELALC
jgi:hypothetical protein